MANINRSDRTIDTGSGKYNSHVSGDYVQGKTSCSKSTASFDDDDDWNWGDMPSQSGSESGNGKNFVENLGGKKVDRWF